MSTARSLPFREVSAEGSGGAGQLAFDRAKVGLRHVDKLAKLGVGRRQAIDQVGDIAGQIFAGRAHGFDCFGSAGCQHLHHGRVFGAQFFGRGLGGGFELCGDFVSAFGHAARRAGGQFHPRMRTISCERSARRSGQFLGLAVKQACSARGFRTNCMVKCSDGRRGGVGAGIEFCRHLMDPRHDALIGAVEGSNDFIGLAGEGCAPALPRGRQCAVPSRQCVPARRSAKSAACCSRRTA